MTERLPDATTIVPAYPPSPAEGLPAQPDPYYVEGMRGAIQMFAPVPGNRPVEPHEDELMWSNVIRYADAIAAYLRQRSRAGR